jgi:hypothetical protein
MKKSSLWGWFYGWLVAFTAAMGGFLFGYEVGIIKYNSSCSCSSLSPVPEVT